jgi:chromosome partitioning protein
MAHVFISYSQKDAKRRQQIAAMLESVGITPWFDEKAIALGESLEERIFPALRGSKCVVFVLTKNAVRSEWVRREIQFVQDNGIPAHFISFGNLELPEDFPKNISGIKRVAVRSRFTVKQREDFLNDVSRVYFEKRAPVVTVVNLKGGVGKTTLAANLFGCAHDYLRKSVLLIDLDPQHNLTQLLLDKERMSECYATSRNVMAMFRGAGVADPEVVTSSNVERVLERCVVPLKPSSENEPLFHLVPGTFEVITYFLGEQHQHFRRDAQTWMNFKRFIAHCQRHYDIIAIDVNPGATLMTEVALSVSTHILSPVRPDRFAKYGLTLLESLLEKIEGDYSELKRLVVMNGVERAGADQIELDLRSELADHAIPNQSILATRIAHSARLVAKQAKPGRKDLTLELAYHGGFGAHAIQTDLRAAASELIEELGV